MYDESRTITDMQKITHKNDLKFLILKKISDLLYLSIVNDNEENKEILF